MTNLFKFACLAVTIFTLNLSAHARWASEKEATLEIETHEKVHISQDGMANYHGHLQFKLLTEDAFRLFSPMTFPYPAGALEIKILWAKIATPDNEYTIQPEDMEDKAISSGAQAFDDTRQISIIFPNLAVGALIDVEYEMKEKAAAYPGHYGHEFTYSNFKGASTLIKKESTEITSELPLFLKINDSEKLLEVKENNRDPKSLYTLSVQTLRPFMPEIAEEDYAILNPNRLPFFQLSSLREGEWDKLGSILLPEVEAVLSQPLPKRFEAIYQSAKNLPGASAYDQMNEVLIRVAEDLNYFGGWGTRNGRIIPKDLEKTATLQYGDCKDYSAVSTAILRKLGFDAHVSFIYSSHTPVISTFEESLPIHQFNHAIVHVKFEGRDLWLDPTVRLGYAHGLFSQNADRPALVLSPKGPYLARTPALSPEDFKISYQSTIEFDSPDLAKISASLSLLGQAAVPFTAAHRTVKTHSINRTLTRYVGSDQARSIHAKEYSLESRIVKDLTFDFDFFIDRPTSKTTSGLIHFPKSYFDTQCYNPFLVPTSDRESDLAISIGPSTHDREIVIKKGSRIKPQLAQVQCKVESPWLDASRLLNGQGNGDLILKDTYKVKTDRVSVKDLRGLDFQKFQQELYQCMAPIGLICDDGCPTAGTPVKEN